MKTFNSYKEAQEYSKNNPTETVEYKDYHKNGQLWQHLFYVNGKNHGECKWYHDDRQLWQHLFYVNGKNHGESKTYWDNGKICYHYFYVDGVRDTDLVHLAKDNRTHEETELVKAAVGDNYFK